MIFENTIFTEMILPFILVFVVVFAILQKSKIFGDGKEQNDALVSLAIALILIGVPQPRDIIVGIMPWLSVAVAVLLVFFILYGFIGGEIKDLDKNLKNVLIALAGVFTIGVVAYVSGFWSFFWDWITLPGKGEIGLSVLMILVVVGVIGVAIGSSKKKDD